MPNKTSQKFWRISTDSYLSTQMQTPRDTKLPSISQRSSSSKASGLLTPNTFHGEYSRQNTPVKRETASSKVFSFKPSRIDHNKKLAPIQPRNDEKMIVENLRKSAADLRQSRIRIDLIRELNEYEILRKRRENLESIVRLRVMINENGKERTRQMEQMIEHFKSEFDIKDH
eukprot:TRINITY_DN7488_c0_g1_i1.p1 TRINITY_DN7488_c0_g1~~TRINITY_DN7488_c0_g1_i1.p1  ORF type:complete len:172 (-),score=15.33 TRINITY_DN7488_c0_g1_i1:33-548(-)